MTTKMPMRVLIVGGGSIGERHLRTFQIAGADVELCEPLSQRRDELGERYSVRTHPDLDGVDLGIFGGVVICTPAPLHVAMALRAVDAGCNVLIEKPLSLDPIKEVPRLLGRVEEKKAVVGVAHIYRHMPGVEEVKKQISDGAIGAVKHVACVSGQDFAAYRPAYRDTYYVNHETGGGAIFDAAVHFIDAIQWLVGPIDLVSCRAAHQAIPDSNTEDAVTMTLEFESGALGSFGMNQFQANNEATLEFIGTKGTIRYRLPNHEVSLCLGVGDTKEEWTSQKFPLERDDAFVAQARTFLDACRGIVDARCTVREAAVAASVCVAAHKSAVSRREEQVAEISTRL